MTPADGSTGPSDASVNPTLRALMDEGAAVRAELDALIPDVAAARRAFFKDRLDAGARAALEAVEGRAGELHRQVVDIQARMMTAAGVTDADIQAFLGGRGTADQPARDRRDDLTAEKVKPGADTLRLLEASFDRLLAVVGPKVLEEYQRLQMPRLHGTPTNQPLSLVRGVRPDSESPGIHRFGQAIRAAQGWLAQDPSYDHFGGALLVPQVARLADRLDAIHGMPGAARRLRSLWRGPSKEVDSTIFELLVGDGCASRGRQARFLDTGSTKTPDLMCEHPYPLAIECKRKRSLSDYEIAEEGHMRALFLRLEAEARKAGMWGNFLVQLSVEASEAPVDEIVAKLIQQRFAGGRGRRVQYAWGTVAYFENRARVDLPGETRLYSPNMLEEVFGWNTDLPEFDGLVCRVSNDREPRVAEARHPVALLWSNHSAQALKKRAWGPGSVVTDALAQVPSGDFGIIYVAYQEGAREKMADGRTDGFKEWMSAMEHRNVRGQPSHLERRD